MMRVQMLNHQHTAGKIRLYRRQNSGESVQAASRGADSDHIKVTIYISGITARRIPVGLRDKGTFAAWRHAHKNTTEAKSAWSR